MNFRWNDACCCCKSWKSIIIARHCPHHVTLYYKQSWTNPWCLSIRTNDANCIANNNNKRQHAWIGWIWWIMIAVRACWQIWICSNWFTKSKTDQACLETDTRGNANWNVGSKWPTWKKNPYYTPPRLHDVDSGQQKDGQGCYSSTVFVWYAQVTSERRRRQVVVSLAPYIQVPTTTVCAGGTRIVAYSNYKHAPPAATRQQQQQQHHYQQTTLDDTTKSRVSRGFTEPRMQWLGRSSTKCHPTSHTMRDTRARVASWMGASFMTTGHFGELSRIDLWAGVDKSNSNY